MSELVIENSLQLIRDTRKALGLTQAALADCALISTGYLNAMESKSSGSPGAIAALLDALLEMEDTKALGEPIIVKLRASRQEIGTLFGTGPKRNAFPDVYPLSAEQIKNIRKLLGMTQQQLANEMLLRNAASIAQWESKRNPHVPQAFHRRRLVKLGSDAVGKKAGLIGQAAEDLLFSTLEWMPGPVVQEEESGQEDMILEMAEPQTVRGTSDRNEQTTPFTSAGS